MLSLSSKLIYSVCALFELAKRPYGHCMQVKEIAAIQDIPISFLEQILLILRKNGYVQSVRGAQGGYKLLKRPSAIKIIDIIQTIEGNIQLSSASLKEEFLHAYFQSCEYDIKSIFETTIADLIEKKQQLIEQTMFHI